MLFFCLWYIFLVGGMKMKKYRLFTVIHLCIILVLEIIPFGAVCNFASENGESTKQTFSYFSLTPYGYANFGPFITAVLTVLLLVLCLINLIKQNDPLTRLCPLVSAAALFFSVLPLTLGFSYWTVAGTCITLILARVTLLNIKIKKEWIEEN